MSLARSGRTLLGQFSQLSKGFYPPVPVEASWSLRDALARTYATVQSDLKYAKSHEWVKTSGEEVTIGISDFAQEELGDIVYVELPEVGSTVKAGETFGVVESVKAASDVYSPVSGEVTAVNEELVNEPNKVNTSPFAEGWMFKAKLSDSGELDKLMDSGNYQTHCDNAHD